MKKLISILLVLVLLLAFMPAVLAADAEEVAAADFLYALGLFKGTGTDVYGKPIYDLDRAPNRAEAVTMLVRLLGKEEEATEGSWDIPFTDVADWAKPYVGYAYANGLTNGTGADTFSGTAPVTAAQYLTFVLRALGYSSEAGGDFKWDAAWELTDRLGITAGEYGTASPFDRGDVVRISFKALSAYVKGEQFYLGEKLLDEGAFTLEQYHAAMSGSTPEEDGQNPVMNFIGEYSAGRPSAKVSCLGKDSALITIDWSSSAWELSCWVITGRLDPDTLRIDYTDAMKVNLTFEDPDSDLPTKVEVEYEDGTGFIEFSEYATFVWHEDGSSNEEDLSFGYAPVAEPGTAWENPVKDYVGAYSAGRAYAHVYSCLTNCALVTVSWSSSAWEHDEWVIFGRMDPETGTIDYSGAVRTTVTYGEFGGEPTVTTDYTDGTGILVFGSDGAFTWYEDGSPYEEGVAFQRIPTEEPAEPEEPEEPVEDGQNPVMNFIGTYSAGRPWAEVACSGADSAYIKITWSGSAWEHAEWEIVGRLDLDTLTVTYTGAVKKIVTFEDENSEDPTVVTEYTDGTGTIVFTPDLTFTWHEDQSDFGEDVVFEWVPVVVPEEDGQNPAMNFVGNYGCMSAQTYALVEAVGSSGIRISMEKVTGFSSRMRWDITGELDPDTLTVTYTGARKVKVEFTYQGDEEIATETVEYEDGTGTVVFSQDLAFTWHEDQSGEDLIFEFYPGD